MTVEAGSQYRISANTGAIFQLKCTIAYRKLEQYAARAGLSYRLPTFLGAGGWETARALALYGKEFKLHSFVAVARGFRLAGTSPAMVDFPLHKQLETSSKRIDQSIFCGRDGISLEEQCLADQGGNR